MESKLNRANSSLEPVHPRATPENPHAACSNIDSSESKKMVIAVVKDGVTINHQGKQILQLQILDRSGLATGKSALRNFENFKRSAVPARLMYLENHSWNEFSTEVLELAKSAFEARNPVLEIQLDANHYLIDFYRMLQIDFSSGVERSVAWIDAAGKCFFPKFFVGGGGVNVGEVGDGELRVVDTDCRYIYCTYSNLQKTSIAVRLVDSEKSTTGKRKKGVELDKARDLDDSADSSFHGGFRESKRPLLDVANVGNPRWPNSRMIGESEKAYLDIRNQFMEGMKHLCAAVQITSIHKFLCVGPMGRARLEVFQKQKDVMKNARGKSSTVFAWHGAAKKSILNIFTNGFGFPSKLSGSEAHGVGVYLSPVNLPQMSHVLGEEDENGERHVVLCQVILGNIEQVEAGSQQAHPSSMNYDSGVDDVRNPKWYVIWSTKMNTSILPECVVSYKCSNSLQGPEDHTDFTKWMPGAPSSLVMKLFSKLRSRLPPAKLEEVKALCRKYKGRLVEKNFFIKNLRSIVGDEVLHSVISEVRDMK